MILVLKGNCRKAIGELKERGFLPITGELLCGVDYVTTEDTEGFSVSTETDGDVIVPNDNMVKYILDAVENYKERKCL